MRNDSLNALSAAIGAFNPVNGDDPIALLQALEGSRSGQMAKAADEARQTLLLHMEQLQNLLAASLPDRLRTLQDTPDAQGKVLAELAPGKDQALLDDIESVGLALPTSTWLQVSSKTYDASGNLVSEQAGYLASPDEVAAIRAANTQTAVGSVDQYATTTGSAPDVQTTYTDIHNEEGQVRASNADLEVFNQSLMTTISGLQDDVQADIARLDGFAERLSRRMAGDQPLMAQALRDDAVQQANHQEVLRQGIDGGSA